RGAPPDLPGSRLSLGGDRVRRRRFGHAVERPAGGRAVLARLRAETGGDEHAASWTWEVTVGARSAPVDTSWGTTWAGNVSHPGPAQPAGLGRVLRDLRRQRGRRQRRRVRRRDHLRQ